MRLRRIHLKLRTKIALLSFSLVLLSVLLAGVVIVGRTTTAVEQEIGMRAMAIARTVAQHKDVQENLGKIGGEKIIQPIAERIRLATGVEYIVLFDMERRRYSHPYPARIPPGTPLPTVFLPLYRCSNHCFSRLSNPPFSLIWFKKCSFFIKFL